MFDDNIMSCLKLTLEAEGLTYKKSSNFQGVLFTQINSEYADFLHKQQLHPYSQYIAFEDGIPYWYVNTTSNDAYEHIIKPLMEPNFHEFNIHNGDINVSVIKKELVIKTNKEMLKDFYEKPSEKTITIEFKTYTAFKQRGRYIIMPDLRLIYQSLMMKYSSIGGNDNMIDEETLDQLVDNSVITKYSLQSGLFSGEGSCIPGFRGRLSIRFFGTETMAKYARMLFEFGEFSGIGIKTGMGM